jgi:hypothetical protein
VSGSFSDLPRGAAIDAYVASQLTRLVVQC